MKFIVKNYCICHFSMLYLRSKLNNLDETLRTNGLRAEGALENLLNECRRCKAMSRISQAKG